MDFLDKYKAKAIKIAEGIDFERFILSNQAVADIKFMGGKASVRLQSVVCNDMRTARAEVAAGDATSEDVQLKILAKSLVSMTVASKDIPFPSDQEERMAAIKGMENNIINKLIECVDVFNLAIRLLLNGELNEVVTEEIKK